MYNKKTIIISIFVLLAIMLVGFGGTIFITLGFLSGWGKCQLGQQVYFEGSQNEVCERIGLKIDPEIISSYSLEVEKYTFDGWTPGEDPVQNFELRFNKEGEELDLQGMDAKIIVYGISDDGVEFKINNLGLRTGKNIGSSNLNMNACEDNTFEVKYGEKFELYTCTMDFGYRWTITLVKNQ